MTAELEADRLSWMGKMKRDDRVLQFKKLLELRTLLKSISQISWNVAQLEKRYPVGGLEDGEVRSLIYAYTSYAADLAAVVGQLNKAVRDSKLSRQNEGQTRLVKSFMDSNEENP